MNGVVVLVFADVLLVQDLDKAGQTSIKIISISIIIMMIIVIIIIRIIISSWLNISNGQLSAKVAVRKHTKTRLLEIGLIKRTNKTGIWM